MENISVNQVQEHIEDVLPAAEITDITPVENKGGGGKQTFHVITKNGEYGFYAATNEDEAKRVRRGAAILHLLADTNLLVPGVAAQKTEESVKYPYCIVSWLPGETLDTLYEEDGENLVPYVEKAGRFLAQLHDAVQFDTYGGIESLDGKTVSWNHPQEDSNQWLNGHVNHHIDALQETAFASIIEEASDHLQNRMNKVNTGEHAVLHHNDYRPQNVLIQNKELTGVIDWDWCSTIPVTYSIAHGIETFGTWYNKKHRENLIDAFTNGYKQEKTLPPNFKTDLQFYRVLWQLKHMNMLTNIYDEIPTDWVEEHRETLQHHL